MPRRTVRVVESTGMLLVGVRALIAREVGLVLGVEGAAEAPAEEGEDGDVVVVVAVVVAVVAERGELANSSIVGDKGGVSRRVGEEGTAGATRRGDDEEAVERVGDTDGGKRVGDAAATALRIGESCRVGDGEERGSDVDESVADPNSCGDGGAEDRGDR